MRTLLLSAALLLGSSAAYADGPAKAAVKPTTNDASKMATDDCARATKAGKTCVLDFGKGEELEAGVPTAGGSAIGIIEFAKANSLIRIRKDFIVEILKSAEDLD